MCYWKNQIMGPTRKTLKTPLNSATVEPISRSYFPTATHAVPTVQSSIKRFNRSLNRRRPCCDYVFPLQNINNDGGGGIDGSWQRSWGRQFLAGCLICWSGNVTGIAAVHYYDYSLKSCIKWKPHTRAIWIIVGSPLETGQSKTALRPAVFFWPPAGWSGYATKIWFVQIKPRTGENKELNGNENLRPKQ